jgi:hypothetical protein
MADGLYDGHPVGFAQVVQPIVSRTWPVLCLGGEGGGRDRLAGMANDGVPGSAMIPP